MKRFNVNKLPGLTKTMYDSQLRWIDKNWKDTLRLHHRDIENLLEKIGVYDLWKNILQNKYGDVVNKMSPEIFMDSYMSLHFASMGLYKQANVCLRAQLETALRLVFFSTHPIEFGWWSGGKDEYFKNKEVLDYNYFKHLDEVVKFQKKCKENGITINLFKGIGKLYGKLSHYVHSGIRAFQTTPERFSPKYKEAEFNKWHKSFKENHKYINTVFMLGFAEEFNKIALVRKKKILKTIDDERYKRGLRKSLGIKFRGRI